jgi:hypothetical protein
MKAIRILVFMPFGLFIGLTVDGFEQPRHAGMPMAASHVATAWAGTAASERVLFVPCETTDLGGGGDEEAPKDSGNTPVLPRPVAHELAYYASAELGVLAPRGWHCHGYTRAEGSSLVVTPEPLSADNDRNPNGPGVVLLSPNGWNGLGVSLVVDVAVRVFPAKKKFLQRLMAHWDMDKSFHTFGPYPDDILTRRSDTDVEYETPANKDGMGTLFGWLEKNADPIRGLAIMMDMRDDKNKKVPKLVLLEVRTPPDMHHLVQTIMENMRQNRYQ